MPQVDYAALAKQARKSTPVDYAALAAQARTEQPTVTSEPRDWSAQLGLHEPTANRAVGFFRGAGTAAVDMLEGAASGAASTVYHGGDLVRRAMGMNRIIDTPTAQERMRAPETFAGQAGRMIEQGAEFAVPLTKVSRAVQGAGILRRAAVEGAASAGVAGVQSGGEAAPMVLGGVAGAVLPFAGAAARGTGRVVQRAAAGAEEGGFGGALAGAVRTVAPGAPRTMLMQALKPRSTRVNFPSALDRAIPEIKAAESALRKPIENIDELLTATKAAKRTIQGQLNQVRGTAQGLEIDGSAVAAAMARSVPKKLALENPAAAQRIVDAANVYRRPFSLEDMETLLIETNAELDSFYQMYPAAKGKALASNPATAALEAQAKAFRTAIDTGLDRMAEGGGVAAKELRRRYGALLEVEGEAVRRANVAARQQPESLSEQIGAVRAAGDIARGTWKLLHGNVTGAADIAAGAAGRSTAKAIKDSQTTDALIRRAFAGFKGKSAPVQMPTRRPVRGLLPEGQQPPQTRSRVFQMPGDVAPDPPVSVRAAPIDYAIDPHVKVKAGGVRVAQYSGDPAAAQAAIATPEVKSMLTRMLDDLDTFEPTRGKLVHKGLNPGEDAFYSYGAAGSPVADDIGVISEQHVSNAAIKRAIRDLLAGKMPTNRLHTAALDAAVGYLEKRPGYRGPSIPAGWADEAVDDGFEAFSRAIDEVSGKRR